MYWNRRNESRSPSMAATFTARSGGGRIEVVEIWRVEERRYRRLPSSVPPSPPKEGFLDEPVARILELCILHIAMAEMTSKGTTHKVAINEAVYLANRFCDGGAPRVING